MRNKLVLTIVAILTVVLGVFGLASCGNPDKKDGFDTKKNIKIYTRDTTSGTRECFFSKIDAEKAAKENAPLVAGYISTTGNGNMIQQVANDEFGIGYISLTSLAENTDKLKGLKINGVEANVENVENKTYALVRNFNYITRNDFSGDKKNLVAAFIAFMNSQEGVDIITNKGGIPTVKNAKSWEDTLNALPQEVKDVLKKDNSSITLKFGGSTSVQEIAEALSAAFKLKVKDGKVNVSHDHHGSGEAYKRTQGSEKDSQGLDVGFLSREIKLDGAEPAAKNTYGTIAQDAVVVVVSPKNPLENITLEQLKNVYINSKDSITTWSKLVNAKQ